MYKEYQGKGGEGSGIHSSTPIRTISGVNKEAKIKGKQKCLELKDALAPSCITSDTECSTEKTERNISSDSDQQALSVSNHREEKEGEDKETTRNLAAVPCAKLSPEAVEPSVSEISSGIAEAIEDSLSKADELVEETVTVTAAANLEGETPERLGKSTVEMEDEDDFVDLKEESSVPLPSEEFAETNKEQSSSESEVTSRDKSTEKPPVSGDTEGVEGVDGKQEVTSLPEVAPQPDSGGKKKLDEEKALFSKTKTAEDKANARVAEPAGASDKRIAKLDVSSVASDTEKLELKANKCLEAPPLPRSMPEVNSTCPSSG